MQPRRTRLAADSGETSPLPGQISFSVSLSVFHSFSLYVCFLWLAASSLQSQTLIQTQKVFGFSHALPKRWSPVSVDVSLPSPEAKWHLQMPLATRFAASRAIYVPHNSTLSSSRRHMWGVWGIKNGIASGKVGSGKRAVWSGKWKMGQWIGHAAQRGELKYDQESCYCLAPGHPHGSTRAATPGGSSSAITWDVGRIKGTQHQKLGLGGWLKSTTAATPATGSEVTECGT